jgi:hypothetical protein
MHLNNRQQMSETLTSYSLLLLLLYRRRTVFSFPDMTAYHWFSKSFSTGEEEKNQSSEKMRAQLNEIYKGNGKLSIHQPT